MSERISNSNFKYNIAHTCMLLLAAFVWGMAFPFQRIGAGYVGGWTFLAARSTLSVLVMLPVVLWREKKQKSLAFRRRSGWKAGILCGIFLCLASGLQQIGIADTSTAKSGFITALYVVLVPVLSFLVLHRKQPGKIWIAIVLCVTGLYLLCFPGGAGGFSMGDLLTLACALMFAAQILLVDRYVNEIGALRLTFYQFVTEAVMACVLMLIFERPSLTGLRGAAAAILYAGIMSSAVGYTLQAAGQKGLNPAVASLAMCMESVFSAIGGWLILGESLTPVEAAGCALMFAAIVLTEVPVERVLRSR